MRRGTKRVNDPIPDDFIPHTPGDALSAAEGYVAASADAGRSCDEGSEKFAATLEALCRWAEHFSLIRLESEFVFLGRPPDGYGDEHQAWFDEETGVWYKATYANRFGLAWGRTGSATAREYLSRQLLQNQYFGDDIRLVAVVNANGRPRILISQPHIAGEPAKYDEIQDWFGFLGFVRLDCNGSIAWYLESENLLIADAHEGNVIKAHTHWKGTVLLPIDLNIIQPNGGLLAGIKALLAGAPEA